MEKRMRHRILDLYHGLLKEFGLTREILEEQEEKNS